MFLQIIPSMLVININIISSIWVTLMERNDKITNIESSDMIYEMMYFNKHASPCPQQNKS